MNRRTVIILVVAAILVAGGIIYLCVPKEPRYQGRKLSEWTGDMYSAWTNFHANEQSYYLNGKYTGVFFMEEPKYLDATNALQHIGTNAIPWLLKLAGGADSKRRRIIIHWLDAHPIFHIHLRTSDDKRAEATWAFFALGEKNKPAAPKLIEWTYDKNTERRLAGLRFLAFTRPDKEMLLPVLRRLVKDQDWDVKSLAAYTMMFNYPEEAATEGLDGLFPDEKQRVDDVRAHLNPRPSTN